MDATFESASESVDGAALSVRECWTLLRSCEFGRLAVETDDGPDIFPVNVVVDAGTLVFRSGEGAKLDAIEASPRVAFEVDGVDPGTNDVWSVVLRGSARRIAAPHDLFEAVELGVAPYQAGPKSSLVRISPHTVAGRSFTPVDRSEWAVSPAPAEHRDSIQ